MRHHMCDGIVTGYERAVITTGQSYNIVPQWEKKHLIIWLCNPLTISVLIKIIPETCLAHSIRYLPLYYLQMVQWFHQRTLRISLLNVFPKR
jgi:hypothetical protein